MIIFLELYCKASDAIAIEPKDGFVSTATRDNRSFAMFGTARLYFFQCNRSWGEAASAAKVIQDFVCQQ